jgi:hypothetical protein
MEPEDRVKYVIVEVDILQLIPTQPIVFLSGLINYYHQPPNKLSDVIWDGRNLYIGDGHTKITAALLRGHKTIKAKLFQTDGNQYYIPDIKHLPSHVQVLM